MKKTMHGIEIKTAEEELRDLDAQIDTAVKNLQEAIKSREDKDKVNIAGWKLRDLLARWNSAMNRWKLEGNSESEYFARKAGGNALVD